MPTDVDSSSAQAGRPPYTPHDRVGFDEPSEGGDDEELRQQGVDVLRIESQRPLCFVRHQAGARSAIGKGLIEAQPGPQIGEPTPGFGEIGGALRGDLLAVFGPGDVFGEMAFLLGRPRTQDVYAVTERARLLSLSEATLRELTRSDPAIAATLLLNISKMLCLRLLRNH